MGSGLAHPDYLTRSETSKSNYFSKYFLSTGFIDAWRMAENAARKAMLYIVELYRKGVGSLMLAGRIDTSLDRVIVLFSTNRAASDMSAPLNVDIKRTGSTFLKISSIDFASSTLLKCNNNAGPAMPLRVEKGKNLP